MRLRLTPLERELLARAAEFVLAGEWPWEEGVRMNLEAAALDRAATKLRTVEGTGAP